MCRTNKSKLKFTSKLLLTLTSDFIRPVQTIVIAIAFRSVVDTQTPVTRRLILCGTIYENKITSTLCNWQTNSLQLNIDMSPLSLFFYPYISTVNHILRPHTVTIR